MELLICSLVTILPDFLVRRFVQGKRIGKEITIFSVWYELRWGITACAILTVALISMILFYHPSSSNVTSFFRTVTILPQTSGRVVEVKVANGQQVKAGDILFQMDASAETAAVEVARANIEEIRAQMVVSRADLDAALAQVENAEANLTEARINLNRSQELNERNQNVVAKRELERQATKVAANEALLHAAQASYREANANLTALLPAQMQVAEANLQQVQAQLAFKTVRAGVDGTVQQFVLRAGDYVSGIMRPAGILIPEGSGIGQFEAGFS